MNDTKIAVAGPHPARPQPAAWHVAPAKPAAVADGPMRAVCDSGRIRVGAAFRLVTRR